MGWNHVYRKNLSANFSECGKLLTRAPPQTWLNFMIQAFAPDPIPHYLSFQLQPDRFQAALLKEDLEALDHTTSNPDRLRSIPKILLLTSPDEDRKSVV